MYHGVMIFLSDIMIPLLIFGIVGYGIRTDRISMKNSDGQRTAVTVIGIMPTLDRAYRRSILRLPAFSEVFPGCWDGDRLAGFAGSQALSWRIYVSSRRLGCVREGFFLQKCL